MNRASLLARVFAVALTAIAAGGSQAEDIDLYVASGANGTAPNVLVMLDNTSNWSAANQSWLKTSVYSKCGTDTVCQDYVNQIFGANTSLTQGQVEVAALKLVLNQLVCSQSDPRRRIAVNVGLMILAPNKSTYGNDSGSIVDANGVGGVLTRAVQFLNDSGCTNVLGDLDTLFAKIQDPAYKAASNANYGGGFFEAFKYFGGYTNPRNTPADVAGTPVGHINFGTAPFAVPSANPGTTDPAAFTDASQTQYRSPISETSACGKNYILLVGNTWPNSDATTNFGASRLNYPYACPATNSSYPFCSGSQPRIPDVWANFLATTDVSPVVGRQPVFSYAMNVYNASPDASQTALLKSIANNGGSGAAGYYEIGGDLRKLIAAFTDFFTSVSATNSVFASSSMPLSVNLQGTYLNQIFIGMFRPDAGGNERWAGNLKQYQLAAVRDPSTNAVNDLYIADRNGAAAIDNAGKGFIKSCAVSFWTQDSGAYWQNVPVEQTPTNNCVNSDGTPLSPSTSLYSDLQDGGLVEKGAVAQLMRNASCGSSLLASAPYTYCGRPIKTCSDLTCASIVPLNPTSVTALTSDATLVNWIAGGNVGEGPAANDAQVYNLYDASLANKVRPTVHGDVVHARPLALNYAAGGTTTPDVVVFYGAGDGMLHAIDGNKTGATAGTELWSFVAPEFIAKFPRLRDDLPLISYPGVYSQFPPYPIPKDYFFDGGIGAYQERDASNNMTATYLYPAMRRGGRMIYAFDATSRPGASSPPSLLWKFGCPSATSDTGCTTSAIGAVAARLGQTWSTPKVIRLKGDSHKYVVFGGGYDTCEDADPTTATMCSSSGLVSGATAKGSGIFVLDATAATNKQGLAYAYIDLTQIRSDAGRVVADIVPVDTNRDGYIDVIYAVDTRGYVWRINVSDLAAGGAGRAPSTWASHTYPLAMMSKWTDSTQYRKLMSAPDVVLLGNTNIVMFGSGNREQPNGTSTAVLTVKNRFYGLRDAYKTEPTSQTAVVIDGTDCDRAGDLTLDSGCAMLNVTTAGLDYSSAVLATKGWLFDLTAGAGATKEQVVTTPTSIGGVTYFSTFKPTAAGSTAGVCGGLGTGYGYAVNFLTGTAPKGAATRMLAFTSPAIPPSPISGLVNVDGTIVPFIVGGIPAGQAASALEGRKATVTTSPRRKIIYRYTGIDKK